MAEDLKSRLAEHPFFEDFPLDSLEQIVPLSQLRQFEASDYLSRSDKLADRFFLIEKGDVAVEMDTHTGKDITIQKVSPGDVIGWSWLIPPHEWQFDSRTTEPVEVIEIDGDELRTLCEEDPELGNQFKTRLIEVLADRLSWTRNRLLGLYQQTNEFEELTGG